jgi:hypothetical protein
MVAATSVAKTAAARTPAPALTLPFAASDASGRRTKKKKKEQPTMPRIETEVRLDFKDVLIRPKRSTLKSRSQVDVTREFRFLNSKRSWSGVVRSTSK